MVIVMSSVADVTAPVLSSEVVAQHAAIIEAALQARWLWRTGTSTPKSVVSPFEVLEVFDFGDCTLEVSPTFVRVDTNGDVVGWSTAMSDATPGWEWKLDVGWNDLTATECAVLEGVYGAALDDYSTSLVVAGAHDQAPVLPEHLASAAAFVNRVEARCEDEDF